MNALNGLQSSLAAYQSASNQFVQSVVPRNAEATGQQTTNAQNEASKPSLETAAVNLKGAEQMSEANIKALKTEGQLIGQLLDIMA